MKLSIIIPAYNEEKRIRPTLESYHDFFNEKLNGDFEIIIITNNCNDNTFHVVSEFIKDKKQIKLFDIPGYSGKGGAVMKGFELAQGDHIGFTDADNSTDPKNFYKLYENRENAHGVIASRKIKGSIVHPPRRKSQEISSLLFNLLTKILFKMKYYDTQCGAKLFEKNIAKILTQHYSECGWAFDVDLLYLCRKMKLKILEHPIRWTDAEGSKVSFKEGVISVLKLFKYRFKNL